jgi:ribonucleoside-diphosphate reductase alpha chain
MSSCYLLDSPQDSLDSIYDKYKDIAMLSKFSGGIGVSFSKVRSRGSLIAGTNGKSNGIIPFLKTLDSSVAAVNQGGKRKGAACVYLESWHADIFEFLSLRDNTGDGAARCHNLNLANWIPDLFMVRVEKDEMWSLFDPKDVPEFTELYGEAFAAAYIAAEAAGKFRRQIKARELYAAMMKTLAQTGNGWMTFKDSANRKGNQTLRAGNVIHLSNLCTEILEVSSDQETAVCNLGSINLGRYVTADGEFDFAQLAKNVKIAVKYLDRVIDINFYPIPTSQSSNSRWRPVGLGIMGLQNVFFQLKLPFGSDAARALSTKIQEEIYFHALTTSNELAKEFGPHSSFADTRAAQGDLQFDLWGLAPADQQRWAQLKAAIKQHGLRNSLLLAIAPTATIASITGAYECIEPQLSNLFKRETLSGEFLQVNPYLVADLRRLGLWNERMRNNILLGDGSIQHIGEIPEELRELYRTVWEIPQRALIDMAAERGAFLDQGQSLNLFIEQPTIGKLSSMYAYLWKKGLKTSYYARSRGATKINKATLSAASLQQVVACSLENPESCESCS